MLPVEPKEIKPHPYGVELGRLVAIKSLKAADHPQRFIREADQHLEVVVQRANPHEGADAFAEFQQTLGNQAGQNLIGGGAADAKAVADLPFRQELTANQVLLRGNQLPQMGGELMIDRLFDEDRHHMAT